VERIDAIADACLTIFPSAASILPGDGADARVNAPSSIGIERHVNQKTATWLDRTTIVPVSLVCLQAGGRPGVG